MVALAFGTSGIRGLVTDLTDEVCVDYARAFVRHCRDVINPSPKRWIVAGDLRESTPRIVEAVAKGIQLEGGTVLNAGMIPTPALAYGCQLHEAPGIMITGSHIPADRNGIKFYLPNGEILKQDEAPILKHFSNLEKAAPFSASPLETVDLETAFIKRYVEYFGEGSLRGQSVVLYQHSSAARDVLHKILESLGVQVVLYGKTDQFIPVDTEAMGDTTALKNIILANKAHALVSTDGDGDRPMVLDASGRVVRGDQIGVLAALSIRADAVATPVSSSTAVEKTGAFQCIKRTKIGSPFVVEAMESLASQGAQRIIGYEANGGLLLGSSLKDGAAQALPPLMTRDSVLPILLLLREMKRAEVSLAELVTRLPLRFTASDLIREYPTEKSAALLKRFVDSGLPFFTMQWKAELGSAKSIDLTDGVRVSFEKDAVLHFRPSGNAPEFRIYADASSDELAGSLVSRAKAWVHGL